MKRLDWGSSKHKRGAAMLLFLLWITSAGGEPTRIPIVLSAPSPSVAIQSFEYFPQQRDERPPAHDAIGPERSRGSVVTRPADARGARWLRARVYLPAQPVAIHGLFILAANRGVRAFANGVEIGNTSLGDSERFGWNYPLYFVIPSELLHAGENVLDVQLRLTGKGRGTLLGTQIGLHDHLKPRYDRVLFWRVTGPQVAAVITVLIATIVLLVWIRRRSESVFGWFAASCVLMTARNAHFYVNASIPESWYEVWAAAPLHWTAATLAVFSFRLCTDRQPRIERALFTSAAAWTLVIVAAAALPDDLRFLLMATDVGYLWLLIITIATCAYVAAKFTRAPRLDRALLLLAVVVTLCFGVLDAMLLVGLRASEWRVYLMPYSTLFFGLAMGAVLVDEFAKARMQQERVNRELDTRLAARERELRGQHERVLRLEAERAVTHERQRILRDMHDGLGAQLVSSIHLVEAGALAPGAVAELLRECVDDLRLAIDSLQPAGDDLLLVLGSFRYRMEPRLASAGVRLEWDLSPRAQSPMLDSAAVLHTLRIVQEAFSNAIKHARATEIRLSFHSDDLQARWELTVADNGHGFDASSVTYGHGLRNMQARALQMGLELRISSSSTGTQVRITGSGSPPSTSQPVSPI